MGDTAVPAAAPPSVARKHPSARRTPAFFAALAVALGIWLDDRFSPPLWVWLSIGGALSAALIATFSFRRDASEPTSPPPCLGRGPGGGRAALFANPRFSVAMWTAPSTLPALLVLLLLAATGAARHHRALDVAGVNDISRFATEEPQLIRIVGTIADSIEVIDPPVGPQIPAWMELDRSRTALRCEFVLSGDESLPASGLARLEVAGHLVHARVGDRVDVLGAISLPGPPRNPGAVDYRQVLRRQQLRAVVRADHPFAVRKLAASRRWGDRLLRLRDDVRTAGLKFMAAELRPDNRALAASLLLGERTGLTEEVNEHFAHSGTMHLLAISGLHVGILYGLVWLCCRLVNLSPRTTWIVQLAVLLTYVFLTNHRPPVLRAALLALLAMYGESRGRLVDGRNALAACALILLLWHPADLFDIGAQLSFLAVGVIIWISRARRQSARNEADSADGRRGDLGSVADRGPIAKAVHNVRRGLVDAACLTAGTWLVTLPLSVSVFHVAAPVGLLANLVLIPYFTIVLALGYLFMLVGLVAPWAAAPVADLFALSLDGLRTGVQLAGGWSLGHGYYPAPPGWWHLVFYVLAGLAWMWPPGVRVLTRPVRAMLLWTLIPLLLPWWPARAGDLRCTFLSVGHGLAVVLELPDRSVLVYDAGTIGDGRRAERAVTAALWDRGYSRAEALIVTHADHDHFSGAFGIVEKLDVRQLLLPASALGAENPGTLELCEAAAQQGMSIRLIQAGDELWPVRGEPSSPTLRFLHPPGGFASRFDNANSAVLEIDYAGRRILLTGDLERDGLELLTAQPPRRADVLLAPHHGGAAANVPELYEWARPHYVIASTADPLSPGLRAVVGEAQLLSTNDSGAITVTITPAGEIRIDEFLKPRP